MRSRSTSQGSCETPGLEMTCGEDGEISQTMKQSHNRQDDNSEDVQTKTLEQPTLLHGITCGKSHCTVDTLLV